MCAGVGVGYLLGMCCTSVHTHLFLELLPASSPGLKSQVSSPRGRLPPPPPRFTLVLSLLCFHPFLSPLFISYLLLHLQLRSLLPEPPTQFSSQLLLQMANPNIPLRSHPYLTSLQLHKTVGHSPDFITPGLP